MQNAYNSKSHPCKDLQTYSNWFKLKWIPYYLRKVILDRCNGNCNTLQDPSGRICVPNKTENMNLNVFNMITRINVTKTLVKHV